MPQISQDDLRAHVRRVAEGLSSPEVTARNMLTTRVMPDGRSAVAESAPRPAGSRPPMRLAENSMAEKQVVLGGGPSRFVANTVGHLGSIASGASLVLPGQHGHHDLEHARKDYEAFRKLHPERLDSVKVRIGGQDFVDDYLWKKDVPADAAWHAKLGGRTWHNPRTGPIMKILGTNPLHGGVRQVIMPVIRGSHYDPITDTISSYNARPEVLHHELGHALDFNQHPLTTSGRAQRSLGLMGYALNPMLRVRTELEANRQSYEALRRIHGGKTDTPEFKELEARRREVLPAGIGTYVAGLPGGVVGRVGGRISAALKRREARQLQHEGAAVHANVSEARKKTPPDPVPPQAVFSGATFRHGLTGLLLARAAKAAYKAQQASVNDPHTPAWLDSPDYQHDVHDIGSDYSPGVAPELGVQEAASMQQMMASRDALALQRSFARLPANQQMQILRASRKRGTAPRRLTQTQLNAQHRMLSRVGLAGSLYR